MASRCEQKIGFAQLAKSTRLGFAVFGLLSCIAVAGCSFDICRWFPCSEPRRVVFEEPPAKHELVAQINKRSSQLLSWRSDDVTISMSGPAGITVEPSAVMAVQAPRNFRMIVSMMNFSQADFGSNADRFWFWMRDGKPKHVYSARHEDLPTIQRRLPIPFQPQWLMEALGVIPMDERNVTLYYEDEAGMKAVLSSKEVMPDGRTVIQVVRVDAKSALITERILKDGKGNMIARAEFQKYREVEKTGIWMPHRITLHWAKTESEMTLTLNNIEINPVIPDHLWQVPKYDGSPPLDLSAAIKRGRGVTQIGGSRPHFDNEPPSEPIHPLQPQPQPFIGPPSTETPEAGTTPPPFPGGTSGRVRIGAKPASPDITGMDRPRFDDE